MAVARGEPGSASLLGGALAVAYFCLVSPAAYGQGYTPAPNLDRLAQVSPYDPRMTAPGGQLCCGPDDCRAVYEYRYNGG